MSEIINMKNMIQSQKNIHRNSSKLFSENKKNNFSGNNSEILDYIAKSRNIISIKIYLLFFEEKIFYSIKLLNVLEI